MNNILKQPYTDIEYADFAVFCNETQRRIEDFNGDKYALLSTEILENGQIIDISQTPEYLAEQLEKAKQAKLAEITSKGNDFRYSQTFTLTIQDKECEFDTSTTTQSDLQTAMLSFLSGAESYDGWITNNGIVLNLALADIQAISTKFKELSNIYPKWLEYTQQLEKALTVEDVNAIVVDYSVDVVVGE